MRRAIFLSLFVLYASLPAQAGPLTWAKRQFREHPQRTAFVVAGVAAGVHAAGLAHCRQGSVENCQAKYGAAWQSYAFATGANLAVVSATSGCWKEQSEKFCSIFAYGGSAAQAGFGISQWRKYAKPEMDLSRNSFTVRK
jgi:hypothetical protein